jgi:hypothetical protein
MHEQTTYAFLLSSTTAMFGECSFTKKILKIDSRVYKRGAVHQAITNCRSSKPIETNTAALAVTAGFDFPFEMKKGTIALPARRRSPSTNAVNRKHHL